MTCPQVVPSLQRALALWVKLQVLTILSLEVTGSVLSVLVEMEAMTQSHEHDTLHREEA